MEDIYEAYDYLCNEPYYLPKIGTIHNPTLRDIRKITYAVFTIYLNMCSTKSVQDYCKTFSLQEFYDSMPEEQRQNISLYEIILLCTPQFLFGLLNFFIEEDIELDSETFQFIVYKEKNTTKEVVGMVTKENFDALRNQILKILGLKPVGIEKKKKYKNERVRRLCEKIEREKAKNEQAKKVNDDYSLENMIRKYCTYNNVGINILNVWDMTFYQFNVMFSEYNTSRQITFNDAMAANSFSFKESGDYKPALWIKKSSEN